MFRQDGFIRRAFVPKVRFMKTFVEIAMNAAMLALWAVAVIATFESTPRFTGGAVAKPTAAVAVLPASAPSARR